VSERPQNPSPGHSTREAAPPEAAPAPADASAGVPAVPGQEAPALLEGRRYSPWLRASLWLSAPMTVLAALWVTAGRSLFGAGGELLGIFAISLGPLMLVVMGAASVLMHRDARRYVHRVTTPLLSFTQAATWVLALFFGLLIPDRVDGRTVSAVSEIAGDHLVGLSAGFGNTVGILTYVAAFATLIIASTEQRRSRRASLGEPATEDEMLDRAQYDGGPYSPQRPF
jgi:cytochrome bd-type quinol oxidase subunit 2